MEKNLFVKTGNGVWDPEIFRFIREHRVVDAVFDDLEHMSDPTPFLDFYPLWIMKSRHNQIRGLERFRSRHFALGTTQALDEFHHWCLVNGRRIRMFRGEYPYNRDVIEGFSDENWIESGPLEARDAVIVSLPFSATGGVHPRWHELLQKCTVLRVPVFVDMAWFGTCAGIEVDLAHSCIQSVAFSTTKGLGCGNWRAGIVFTNVDYPRIATQNRWRHGIHLNVAISLSVMKHFDPDFIYDKYRATQLYLCEKYGLSPSSCAHIALGDERWREFSRDGVCNRINLRKALRAEFRG